MTLISLASLCKKCRRGAYKQGIVGYIGRGRRQNVHGVVGGRTYMEGVGGRT